jgi:hypothetical protein
VPALNTLAAAHRHRRPFQGAANPAWCTYGTCPNCAFLIRQDGPIDTVQTWFDKVTVEGGFRYALWPPWYSTTNNIANFDPRFYSTTNQAVINPSTGRLVSGPRYNGIVLPGDGFVGAGNDLKVASDPAVLALFRGEPRGFSQTHYDLFEPRVGEGSNGQPVDIIGDPKQNANGKFSAGTGLDDNFAFNPAAFANPAAGKFGNSKRDILRNPGDQQWDIALFKNFVLRGAHRIQFRAEVFNFINQPNLSGPNTDITNPNFGRIITKDGSRRDIQLALRYLF